MPDELGLGVKGAAKHPVNRIFRFSMPATIAGLCFYLYYFRLQQGGLDGLAELLMLAVPCVTAGFVSVRLSGRRSARLLVTSCPFVLFLSRVQPAATDAREDLVWAALYLAVLLASTFPPFYAGRTVGRRGKCGM